MQNPQYADYYPHTGDWCLYCINVPLHGAKYYVVFLRFSYHAIHAIAVHLKGSTVSQAIYQNE